MGTEKRVSKQIQVAIVGYGNIGRGVEAAIRQVPDMTLVGIFTRRSPEEVTSSLGTPVRHVSELDTLMDQIDVAILCGGSATDLPEQGPKYAAMFNIVDSFDTHAKIPEYFAAVDRVARQAKKISVISTGWDPGLFSLMRVLFESSLPEGMNYTFWGPGVSQGHTNAIKGVPGVKNAVQYTVPLESALQRVRSELNPELSVRDMHKRVCYVVPEKGADRERITRDIVSMPYYFAPYDTEVIFLSERELREAHSKMPHGGFVLRGGVTGAGNRELMEFSLTLDSNPEFTATVMVAYARAAYRLNREGQVGAKTVFDIAPIYLSLKSLPELLKTRL